MMELELRCPTCEKFLQEPVLLPCFHSACLSCVERSVQPISADGQKGDSSADAAIITDNFEGLGGNRCSRMVLSASATELSYEARRMSTGCGGRALKSALLSTEQPGGSYQTTDMSRDGCLTEILLEGFDIADGDTYLDKVSILSETDSGVICSRSRSASCIVSSHANLYSQLLPCTHKFFCGACKQFVYLDSRGASGLPRNHALETLIEKYSMQQNPPIECQLCEGEQRMRAVTTCEQCEVSYCKACLERCHPLRGPLAKHSLVTPTEGIVAVSAKRRNAQLKCTEHIDECLSTFCMTCQVPVCCQCIHSGCHVNHSLQGINATCKLHKAELSQVLQKLSDRARSASDFLHQLKTMQQDIKENFLEFEALTVAQCDALIRTIEERKRQLLKKVEHERQHKDSAFVSQIVQSTTHLQKITGLLQLSIEILRETDSIAFLQISRGLINRITSVEQAFHKDVPMEPKVAPTFDMHLESKEALQAIRSLKFYHLKVPSAPHIIPEECSAEQNTVTISWQLPEISALPVDGFVLELAETVNSEFREVFRGTETLCLVEGLHFHTQYLARVKAYNHMGDSKYSDCICLQTSEVAWFTFDPDSAHRDICLSNGNKTVSTSLTDNCVVLGSVGFSRGTHYWEIVIDQLENNSDPAFGIARFDVQKDVMLGKDNKAWSMYIDRNRSWLMHNGQHHSRLDGGIHAGGVIGFLLDLDRHVLSFYINHKSRGSDTAFKNLHGVFYPAISINRNTKVTIRSGIIPSFKVYESD